MNKGDTVICINNKPNGNSYITMDVALTIGKYYIVQNSVPETIRVLNDEDIYKDYRVDRFVIQSEWIQMQRQNKLSELGI